MGVINFKLRIFSILFEKILKHKLKYYKIRRIFTENVIKIL